MMTPQEIVSELDKYIVGQADAKRAVAIALRNRWRRAQVAEPLREEITPKNILMIGPTGVGKTEIARRLARLANAPFIKVEATKFTEVGYVGRDVDTIIRDLAEIAVKATREQEMNKVRTRAEDAAEERVLDALLPGVPAAEGNDANSTRQRFRKMLREGKLDDKEIEIDVAQAPGAAWRSSPRRAWRSSRSRSRACSPTSGGGAAQAPHASHPRSAAPHHRRGGREARERGRDPLQGAATRVEQNGIVFLDEIDKIASRGELQGADVSRQGVQRDLLPLVEGTTVTTKYGMVRTDHILFIASGAFHLAKPSDLIPELQGRLPDPRRALESLSVDDFERILTATDACLTQQYQALLATEGVELEFTPEGVRRLAEIAFSVNERTENIGARRLYTVHGEAARGGLVRRGPARSTRVSVDAAYVDARLAELAQERGPGPLRSVTPRLQRTPRIAPCESPSYLPCSPPAAPPCRLPEPKTPRRSPPPRPRSRRNR